MKEDNCDFIIITFIACIILIGVGAAKTHVATQRVRREAVARGHAEFVADKEGNVEFKWKEIK